MQKRASQNQPDIASGALPAGTDYSLRIAGLADSIGIRPLFERQAVREGYSVGEHSLMALVQRAKYFPAGLAGMGPDTSDQFVSLHDCGKRIERNTRRQSQHTIALIREHAQALGIDSTRLALFCALLSHDPIGSCIDSITPTRPTATEKYSLAQALADGTLTEEMLCAFQQRTTVSEPAVDNAIAACEQQVRAMASAAALLPAQFFATLINYYQVDASSYTIDAARDRQKTFPNRELSATTPPIDVRNPELCLQYAALERGRAPARGYPSLDGLFVLRSDFRLTDSPIATPAFRFDTQRQRLAFSAGIESAIRRIETNLSA